MKKHLWLLPLLFLCGCGKQSSTQSQTTSAIKDTPVQVEQSGEIDPIASPEAVTGGTFTTWCGPFPKSLNQWLAYDEFPVLVCGLMFESLVSLHSIEGKPVGELAQSWEVSPDQKTFTFKIHPAAKWSDGKPVTAEDVQFYYDVMMNPKNLTSLFRVDLSRFSRPEIIDEKTVRITANQVHWLNFWVAGGLTAFPKHAWANVDFNKQNFEFPVVDGPYALDEVKMNRSVRLKRRGDWWGRVLQYNQHKYNFDNLVFKAMEDRNKALEVLKKGEFDLYAIYTSQIWAEQTNFEQVQKNWIVRQRIFNKFPVSYQGFAMNLRRPLFQDLRVRQALAHLVNRELMNEKLMFNEYFLLNSYFPTLYPNYQNPNVPITKFDPEKARALLQEAGWQVGGDGILAKDGKPFELVILDYEPSDVRRFNIYIEDLKAVGIKARMEMVSYATWKKRVDNHDFDMIEANFQGKRLFDVEPDWSSKTADDIATNNYTGLKDAEVDKLIEAQKTEMDFAKRTAIFKKFDERLVAISPYVLLWQASNHRLLYWNKFGTPKYVLSKNGDDGVSTGNEFDSLTYWWFDAAKAKALNDAMKSGTSLPAEPTDVHYPE